MSLREDMWKYEQITGESAEQVPIIKLGAFLDGYEMGLKQPKKGHWKEHDTTFGRNIYYCTACGRSLEILYEYDYCPNCGADMKGEENEV